MEGALDYRLRHEGWLRRLRTFRRRTVLHTAETHLRLEETDALEGPDAEQALLAYMTAPRPLATVDDPIFKSSGINARPSSMYYGSGGRIGWRSENPTLLEPPRGFKRGGTTSAESPSERAGVGDTLSFPAGSPTRITARSASVPSRPASGVIESGG